MAYSCSASQVLEQLTSRFTVPENSTVPGPKHARCGREALGIGAEASYAQLRMSQGETFGPRPTPSWRPRDGRAPPVRPGVGAIGGICSPQLNPRRYETWRFYERTFPLLGLSTAEPRDFEEVIDGAVALSSVGLAAERPRLHFRQPPLKRPGETDSARGEHWLMPTVVTLLTRRREIHAAECAAAPHWQTHTAKARR
jgi:hypothetical protein